MGGAGVAVADGDGEERQEPARGRVAGVGAGVAQAWREVDGTARSAYCDTTPRTPPAIRIETSARTTSGGIAVEQAR